MKVRTDFVTNSSSSSFIVSFDGENTIEKELQKAKLDRVAYDDLLRQIKEGKVSVESALAEYEESLEWSVKYDIEQELTWGKDGMTWEEFKQFKKEHSDEFQQMVQERLEKEMSDLRNKLEKKGYIARVEYSDNDGRFGAEMEHEIMPNLKNTDASISYH